MDPTFYTRLLLRDLRLEEVANYYAEWALGVGQHAPRRARRLSSGVSPDWDADTLRSRATWQGHQDLALESRSADGLFLLRFVHRDADEPAVLWHTAVRLERDATGVVLQQAIARSAPEWMRLPTVMAPPATIEGLLRMNGTRLLPRDLADSSVIRVSKEDIDQFLDYFLLDADRDLPVLLITPVNETDDALVEDGVLRLALVAMARIAAITDFDATRMFNAALLRRGYDERLGTSDGAVRLIDTGLKPSSDPYHHRLWTRHRLLAHQPDARHSLVIEGCITSILRGKLPTGFFSGIQLFDQRERGRVAALAQGVLERERAATAKALADAQREMDAAVRAEREASAQSLAEAQSRIRAAVETEKAASAAALQSAQATVEQLRVSLQTQVEEASFWKECSGSSDAANTELKEKLAAAAQKSEELDDALKAKTEAMQRVSTELDRLKAASVAARMDASDRSAVRALLKGTALPEVALRAVEVLFADRVTVLPSAIRSAKDAAELRPLKKACELLYKLGSDYWEAMDGGLGDNAARDIFGRPHFAPTESESSQNSQRARLLRTFSHEGQVYVMWRHLKIGVKPDSRTETFRVHFEWVAADKRILVGHCGKHLDLR